MKSAAFTAAKEFVEVQKKDDDNVACTSMPDKSEDGNIPRILSD
jgi:hypothetical protein